MSVFFLKREITNFSQDIPIDLPHITENQNNKHQLVNMDIAQRLTKKITA